MTSFTHLDDADRAAFDRDGYLFKRGLFYARRGRAVQPGHRHRPRDPGQPAQARRRRRRLDRARPVEPPGRRRLRHDRALRAGRRRGREAARRRGLPLPQQADDEAAGRRRALGVAPGLRLLVPERLPVARHALGRGGARAARRRENGCMQVLPAATSSAGIEHGRVAGQTGADPERVEQALKRLELVYCEMAPGDALFFHANTLHCSAANLSDKSRNLLICCYNKASNDPYKAHHHPRYTKLDMVPDEAVLAAGDRVADAAGPVVPGGGQGRDHGGAQGRVSRSRGVNRASPVAAKLRPHGHAARPARLPAASRQCRWPMLVRADAGCCAGGPAPGAWRRPCPCSAGQSGVATSPATSASTRPRTTCSRSRS